MQVQELWDLVRKMSDDAHAKGKAVAVYPEEGTYYFVGAGVNGHVVRLDYMALGHKEKHSLSIDCRSGGVRRVRGGFQGTDIDGEPVRCKMVERPRVRRAPAPSECPIPKGATLTGLTPEDFAAKVTALAVWAHHQQKYLFIYPEFGFGAFASAKVVESGVEIVYATEFNTTESNIIATANVPYAEITEAGFAAVDENSEPIHGRVERPEGAVEGDDDFDPL